MLISPKGFVVETISSAGTSWPEIKQIKQVFMGSLIDVTYFQNLQRQRSSNGIRALDHWSHIWEISIANARPKYIWDTDLAPTVPADDHGGATSSNVPTTGFCFIQFLRYFQVVTR